MRYRLSAIVLCFCVALPAGCRDAPTYVKEKPEFPQDDGVVRLTWNLLDDRTPAFQPSGDTISYSASGYPSFPLRRGLLLNVARSGSPATLTFPRLQVTGDSTPWFTGAAYSRDGRKVAFVELTKVMDIPRLCDGGVACRFANANAIVARGVLRIQDKREANEILRVPLDFCCRVQTAPHPTRDLSELVIVTAHPFQQQFERDGAQLFRPTWSHDGTRVVYTNGLDLYLLNVASGISVILPNTRDGVWPAWSPDGSRIVFTRLHRGPQETASCGCMIRAGNTAVQIGEWVITRFYDGGTRSGTLVVIDPDGSNARDVGSGDAPAWLPSGTEIIAQRQDRLWRIDVASGTATEIAGTQGGYEPAVSRDGRWLAFSKRQSAGNHDIISMPLN